VQLDALFGGDGLVQPVPGGAEVGQAGGLRQAIEVRALLGIEQVPAQVGYVDDDQLGLEWGFGFGGGGVVGVCRGVEV